MQNFTLVQQLHTSINPCLLNDMYNLLSPQVVRWLTEACTAIQGDTDLYCKECSASKTVGTKYALCKCPGSLPQKTLFMQDIRPDIHTWLADELDSGPPGDVHVDGPGIEPDMDMFSKLVMV